MRILGVNSGRAAPPSVDADGKRGLADGSAALVEDGRIACAAVEERHSRRRYAGGFARSVPAVLEEGGRNIAEVDAIGFSTCCDALWTNERDILDAVVEELRDVYGADALRRHWAGRVHAVDHHDSHAMLAFVGSGYEDALVCVMDGFGNRLDDAGTFHIGSKWWRGSFERQTFYRAKWKDGRVELKRIHESATGPDEVGLAELYRSVTHFMGWPSYQFAGKTMALASYGNATRFPELELLRADKQRGIVANVSNAHDDPIRQISDAILRAGYSIPADVKRPARPEDHFLADVAASLQKQSEQAIIDCVSDLADAEKVDCIAFGGGVALNCIAMGKLVQARPELRFYVPPAPADTGQGLGNALWLAYARESPLVETGEARAIRMAALGPRYHPSITASSVANFASKQRDVQFDRFAPAALARAIADRLEQGRTVGVRIGRAEYGPRALGQCSILADPRELASKAKVNEIKHRESFRPFAASILSEHAHVCYPGAVDSPFMSFALRAADEMREAAPAVVHIDGTTRYQTVDPDVEPLHSILVEFYRRTGIPLLLNTSFNLSGEPMVETPAEALDVFERSSIDVLALDGVLITR